MKTIHKLHYIILCVILISCSQSITDKNTPPQLYGRWILVNVSGGIAGDINDIDAVTDKHILVFAKNNSVSYSYNDSLISTNKFHIEKGKSIYSVDEMDFIVYKNNNPPEVIFKLSNDSLVIAENNNDGFSSIYIRRN